MAIGTESFWLQIGGKSLNNQELDCCWLFSCSLVTSRAQTINHQSHQCSSNLSANKHFLPSAARRFAICCHGLFVSHPPPCPSTRRISVRPKDSSELRGSFICTCFRIWPAGGGRFALPEEKHARSWGVFLQGKVCKRSQWSATGAKKARVFTVHAFTVPFYDFDNESLSLKRVQGS